MTNIERIHESGMSESEIQTIASYIKKKLKKKANVEKIALLRGDEAVKFYEKYYDKASGLSTSQTATKPPKAVEQKAVKQINISKAIGEISKASMKSGIKASEVYATQIEKLGKLDRLVESRLNVLAGLGLDFDSAFKIANSDDLYTQVSHKLWGDKQ